MWAKFKDFLINVIEYMRFNRRYFLWDRRWRRTKKVLLIVLKIILFLVEDILLLRIVGPPTIKLANFIDSLKKTKTDTKDEELRRRLQFRLNLKIFFFRIF